MSRRTKLLLLSILVAIACLAAVNLCLNWSPENPLRFRITAPRSVPSKGEITFAPAPAPGPMVDYPITVENTSAATIHLIQAALFSPTKNEGEGEDADAHALAYVSSVRLPNSTGPSTPLVIIPPHSTRELILPLSHDSSLQDLKEASMNYFTVSRSKAAAYDIIVRLERTFPSLKLDPFYPYLATDMHRTPVQFP